MPFTAADHNALHAKVGLRLLTNLVDGQSGHIAAHELVDSATDLGLPLDITSGDAGHAAATELLRKWLAEATPGVRGTVGPRPSGQIVEWPTSFTSSHSTFASLQSAVNAGGTARKFNITASMAFTATIAPHASDEFWFDNGVVITMSGGPFQAIAAASANNVRVMNGKFIGFDPAILDSLFSLNWEVAYCELDGNDVTPDPTRTVKWLHHNKIHHVRDNAWNAFQVVDAVYEDNELGPSHAFGIGGGGNKLTQSVRPKFRHNWIHDVKSSAVWLDYKNWDAILEWNLIENNDEYGIELEANYQSNDVFRNRVRYNLVRNNGFTGIALFGSSHTDIYENDLFHNSLVSGAGEIDLGINQSQKDTQDAELKENYIHDNTITTVDPLPSGLYAGRLFIDASITDPTPYSSNTKNNNWNFNTYDVPNPAATCFSWAGINKTFAQWQAVPQDVNGTAV
jgi:parallel beta-helix repeat protein